jgi:hypothetical protein
MITHGNADTQSGAALAVPSADEIAEAPHPRVISFAISNSYVSCKNMT